MISETSTEVYGNKLREQVEDRLKFYESGDIPRKNVEVMQEAILEAKSVMVIDNYYSYPNWLFSLLFLALIGCHQLRKEEKEEEERKRSGGVCLGGECHQR